jgi:hypothetical protein
MFDNSRSIDAMNGLVKFVNQQGLAYEEVRLPDDMLIGIAAFKLGSTLGNQAMEVSDDLLMCRSEQHQMIYGALPFSRIARADGSGRFDLVFPTPWASRPLASIWSSDKQEVLLAIPVWSYKGIPNATAKLAIEFHVAWRTAIDRLDKRQLHSELGGRLGTDFARKHGWVA